MKHISFALVLLLHDSLLNRCIAAGLLSCAADHIRSTSQYLYLFLHNSALYTLVDLNTYKIQKLLKNILLILNILNYNGLYYTVKASNDILAILALSQAYSLMFTLITYLLVNKRFAIGHLLLATYVITHFNPDIAKHIRLVWKMIQDMKPYDKVYKRARKLLEEIILQVKHIVDLTSDSKSN